jgi:hypothetical protein
MTNDPGEGDKRISTAEAIQIGAAESDHLHAQQKLSGSSRGFAEFDYLRMSRVLQRYGPHAHSLSSVGETERSETISD